VSATTPVVLLDLDGTLSDNHAGISASIRHALAAQGVADPGERELCACVGPPLRETFARLIPGAGSAEVEAAVLRYRERFGELGWKENTVYEGIEVALASLRAQGCRLFVCTSKPRTFAVRIVGHFGFDRFVERVYGPDLSGALDDKAALMAHLLETERLSAAACVMAGDRHHDLRAARANRVAFAGVLWGYGDAHELAAADRLLTHPSELASLGPAPLR